jgi:hypothetical protein
MYNIPIYIIHINVHIHIPGIQRHLPCASLAHFGQEGFGSVQHSHGHLAEEACTCMHTEYTIPNTYVIQICMQICKYI